MSAFYTNVARFYDAETSDKTDDLVMYSRLAEESGGPVFDVGCGTGRVMLHLAQEGVEAHGIDDSAPMLEILRRKAAAFPHLAGRLQIIEGDVLKTKIERKYPLVLLTYNALMHFHEQEQQIALLERLRQIVAEDGLLVIDLPNAGDTFASQDSDAMILDRKFIDPETGHLILLFSSSVLDRTTQLLYVDWIYDEVQEDGSVKRLLAPHVLRYYFYAEIKLLLERCGFAIEEVFGGTDEEPFEDGSERMIIYARPE